MIFVDKIDKCEVLNINILLKYKQICLIFNIVCSKTCQYTFTHTLHDNDICLFQTDSVSFESFRSWIMTHPEATSVSKWLLVEKHNVSLSNDLETPTFHQTLAGVTHCT